MFRVDFLLTQQAMRMCLALPDTQAIRPDANGQMLFGACSRNRWPGIDSGTRAWPGAQSVAAVRATAQACYHACDKFVPECNAMDNDTGGLELPWQWLVVLPYVYALWAVQWVLDQVTAWFNSVF